MRIAIIGTGNVGGAIVRGLHGKGHQVVLGARDPQKPEARALARHSDKYQNIINKFNALLGIPQIVLEPTGADALVWHQSSDAARWLILAGLVDGLTDKRIIKNLWNRSKPDWYDLRAPAT